MNCPICNNHDIVLLGEVFHCSGDLYSRASVYSDDAAILPAGYADKPDIIAGILFMFGVPTTAAEVARAAGVGMDEDTTCLAAYMALTAQQRMVYSSGGRA